MPMPSWTGMCEAYIPRWFYDYNDSICKQFVIYHYNIILQRRTYAACRLGQECVRPIYRGGFTIIMMASVNSSRTEDATETKTTSRRGTIVKRAAIGHVR